VTLVLAAFAGLAFAEGDLERAALLAGAVEGLRRRAGLAVWPAVGREEADLAAQIRQAPGADRFDQAYAAGARLNRRNAVAAVRDQRTGTRASRALTGLAPKRRAIRRHWSSPAAWALPRAIRQPNIPVLQPRADRQVF
jgi:hypothetical protein